MPQAVGFAHGAVGIGAGTAFGAAGGAMFGGWVAGAAFGGTLLGGVAVNLLGSVALSALSQAIAGKPEQQYAGMRTSTTMTGGVNPEGFILGAFATSGVHVCPPMSHSHGGKTPNAMLNYVIELGGIPGHELSGLIVDGEYVEILPDLPHSDYGKRIGGRFLNYAWIRFYDGSQTAADPMLLAKYPAPYVRPWTPAMVGRGLAYAILTFQYNREIYHSWPSARFVLAGIPLYDPRKDSTAGGSGPQRWGVPSTYTISHNNAVMIYNILRGIRLPGGHIWGGESEASDLPYAIWAAAMDECDALVDDGKAGQEPQFRAGIEIFVEDEPFSVIQELLNGCSGKLSEHGGVWKLHCGAPSMPILFIDDDDLLSTEPQDFEPFPAPDATYNAITGSYPDPESLWESRDAQPIYNPAWEAEDGGRRLSVALPLPTVVRGTQAQRLMTALINDHRRMRIHTLTLPTDAGAIEAGDVLAWTSAENFYSLKHFEISETVRDPQTGLSRVAMREVDPTDYDPPSDLVLPTPIDPRPDRPAARAVLGFGVEGIAIRDNSGKPRRAGIRLYWDGEQPDATGIRFEIRPAGRTELAAKGSITGIEDGELIVSDGLLGATDYLVKALLITTRAKVWTGWMPVTTPDVKFSWEDLERDILDALEKLEDWIEGGVDNLPQELRDLAEQMANEALERAEQFQELADSISAEQADRAAQITDLASNWRGLRDRVRALSAEMLEFANADYLAREEIRRSLSVQMGDLRASYDEQIVAMIGENLVSVLRIETLEAASGNLASEIVRARQAMIEGDTALAQQLESLSVGTVTQFDPTHIWHFDTNSEGWSGGAWQTGGWFRPGASITSPAGLSFDAARYRQTRMRVRRNAAMVWPGLLWWAGEGQAWDVSRRVEIAEPQWNGDIGEVTVNAAWTGVVDRMQIDLGTGELDIDWIAVGRPAPGASSADLDRLERVMITADEALAEEMTQLGTRMTGAEGDLQAQGEIVTGHESRISQTENTLTVQGTALTEVQGRITDVEDDTETNASAIEALQTFVQDGGDGSQVAQSEAIRALRSAIRAAKAEGVEAGARNHTGLQQVRDYIATASQSLNTRVDVTDEQVLILAEAVTLLQAAIPGLAKADAMQALIATVTQQGTDIAANSQALSSLRAEVDAKASSTALQALEAAVTTQTGRIDAHSTQLTQLGAAVAGKASAGALQQLDTRVSSTEEELNSQSNALTLLQNQISGKADSSALTALRSTVTQQGNQLTSHGTSLTQLQNGLNGKANSSALAALDSRVNDIDGVVNAQSTSLTELTARTNRGTATGRFRASATSGPSGVVSRIGLQAQVDADSANYGSALFLEANSDGTSAISMLANRFALITSGGSENRFVPFFIQGGVVYIDTAMIRNADIKRAMLESAIIGEAQIENLSVGTLKLKDAAVTKQVQTSNWAGVSTDNISNTVLVVEQVWTADSIHLITAAIRFGPRASTGGASTIRAFLELNGEQIPWREDGDGNQFASWGLPNDATSSQHGSIREWSLPLRWLPAGTHRLQLRFVTNGNHARLGGEITMARWVK